MVDLHPRGPIREKRVHDRVRLVEPVTPEREDESPELLGFLLRGPGGHGLLDELVALGLEEGFVLLADRLAELVGLAGAVARDRTGREHDLLLVDEDPVRLFEDRLELWEWILELRPAPPLDVDLDRARVEGARPVERVERRKVVEHLGFHAAEEVPHARRLELENAVRPPLREELVDLGVVERDLAQVRPGSRLLLDEGEGVVEDREGDEAEEVHLEEAHPVDGLHLELGRDLVVAVAVEREVLDERPRRDQDARRVDAGVARHALEALPQVEETAVRLVLAQGVRELLDVAPRLRERRWFAGVRGDERAEPVDLGERDVEDAAHVADHGSRLHRVERDDLSDVVAAVLPPDVLDDFAAASFAQIHVDVGHRDAVGVQEALEEEVVPQGVNVRDAERPGDQRSGRGAAARADGNPLVLRVLDEVPHDEEVAREPHLQDDGELPRQALVVLRPRLRRLRTRRERRGTQEALLETLLRELLKVFVGRLVGQGDGVRRDLEARVHDDARRHPLRNRGRVPDGLERVGPEDVAHFPGVLDVELRVVELHALRVVERLPRADAEEDVLRAGVIARQVVRVVRRDGRDARLLREPEKVRQDLALLGQAVVHDLDEVAVLPEEPLVAQGGCLRTRVVAGAEALGDLAVQAAREGDDPVVVPLEELPVHPGLVVEARQERLRDEAR